MKKIDIVIDFFCSIIAYGFFSLGLGVVILCILDLLH